MFANRDYTVEVAQGKLLGAPTGTPGVTAFLGVPYAKPPVGALRWAPPVDARPWQGVRPALAYSKVCPQVDLPQGSFYQKEFYPDLKQCDEDCLYLNIWSNASDADAGLPVLFWIHGGAFVEGGGSALQFIGEAMAQKDVVVVTINYRLGALGFMAHPELTAESGASGNYAFLDQIQALKWVRQNIAAFGGDPENITIDGQSAGSMGVCTLVASSLARGLFQKAIAQSGSQMGRPGGDRSLADAHAQGLEFMRFAGAENIAQMRAMPWEDILDLAEQFPRFTPFVDGVVLPESQINIFSHARQNKVNLLVGSCGGEGCLHTPGAGDYDRYLQMAREWEADEEAFLSLFPAHDDLSAGEQMDAIRTSTVFAGMRTLAHYHQAAGLPCYLYCFDHRLPDVDGSTIGAFHSAELVYQFGTLNTGWRPWRAQDYALSQAMMDYWANFCKNGDPNGPGLARWEPFDTAQRRCMALNTTPGMVENIYDAQVAFVEGRIRA